jgi:thiol:disulfide interchange protein
MTLRRSTPWLAMAFSAVAIASIARDGGDSTRDDRPADAAGERIAWTTDYDAALERAARAGQPVLLRVEPRTHCRDCREMEWRVWSDPELVAETRRFVCVRLDTEMYRYLLNRLRIDELPTLILLDSSGRELVRHRGRTDRQALLRSLRRVTGDGLLPQDGAAREKS